MICERITVELDAAGTGSRWYRRNRKKATARSPFIVVRCLFLLHFFLMDWVLVCVCARYRSQRPQALSTPQRLAVSHESIHCGSLPVLVAFFFDGLGLGLCVSQVSLSAASSPVHTPEAGSVS